MLDVSLRLSPRRKIQYDRQTDRLKAQPSSFQEVLQLWYGVSSDLSLGLDLLKSCFCA